MTRGGITEDANGLGFKGFGFRVLQKPFLKKKSKDTALFDNSSQKKQQKAKYI